MPAGDARRRVIIDTDAKNEADDQYAIVHALLSPTLDVRGIVPAHFGTRRTSRSLHESREEVDLLLELLGMTGEVRVENGAERSPFLLSIALFPLLAAHTWEHHQGKIAALWALLVLVPMAAAFGSAQWS